MKYRLKAYRELHPSRQNLLLHGELRIAFPLPPPLSFALVPPLRITIL
jgi:hypothetical protein